MSPYVSIMMHMLIRGITAWALTVLTALAQDAASVSPEEIVSRSASVVHSDWESAPAFDYCLTTRTGHSSVTHAVLMLRGVPYYRLVARNQQPLSPEEDAAEQANFDALQRGYPGANAKPRSEEVDAYQKERLRNQHLLEEFTHAMRFTLTGSEMLKGRNTYVLHASSKPGYRAKSRDTKVLTGVSGRLWIDHEAYRWVRVEAEVTRPVSIQGFLAIIHPGSTFEMEQNPVANGVWLVSRYSTKADLGLFLLFHRRQERELVYSNYVPTGTLQLQACVPQPQHD